MNLDIILILPIFVSEKAFSSNEEVRIHHTKRRRSLSKLTLQILLQARLNELMNLILSK